MDLKKYIEARHIQIQEFAKLIGVTPGAVANYMYKRREPRPSIRKKIIEVTKGKVTANDLLKNNS